MVVCICPCIWNFAGLDARAKARHALSLIERLRVLLVANSSSASSMLQPTAYSLARALEVGERRALDQALLCRLELLFSVPV
jgi:hypothetical protein